MNPSLTRETSLVVLLELFQDKQVKKYGIWNLTAEFCSYERNNAHNFYRFNMSNCEVIVYIWFLKKRIIAVAAKYFVGMVPSE